MLLLGTLHFFSFFEVKYRFSFQRFSLFLVILKIINFCLLFREREKRNDDGVIRNQRIFGDGFEEDISNIGRFKCIMKNLIPIQR